MRQIIAAIAFLAIAVPLIADEKDDAIKKLNGTYDLKEILADGKPDDSKKDEKVTFVIKDGTITVKEEKRDETAKFTVDATKKPAHIDLMPEKGPKEPLAGIYELKDTKTGTELTIAFAKEKGERPKDFKGEGKDVVVVKLLRKKEK